MSKRFVSIVLALVMAFGMFSFTTFAASDISIKFDGKTVSTDTPPFIDANNRTMVPVRFISEALGAKVDWNGNTRLVTVTKGSTVVNLTIGSNQITVNGKATTMDTAAITKDDRTFVPVRYIAESLGLTVGWDAASNTVVLTSSVTTSTKPTWTEITIKGDEDFVRNTQNAVNLIKKSKSGYELVMNYVAIIEQNTFSGMRADDKPPTYQVGSATSSASTTWYASTIIHDANHSKLYWDSLDKYGYVDRDMWTGDTAEAKCMSVQIDFLKEIEAPQYEIDYAISIIDTNYWEVEDRWW